MIYGYLPGSPQPYQTLDKFYEKVHEIKSQIDNVVMPYKSGPYDKIKNTPGAIHVTRTAREKGCDRRYGWRMRVITASAPAGTAWWETWTDHKRVEITLVADNWSRPSWGVHNCFAIKISTDQGISAKTVSVVHFIDCDLIPILKEVDNTIREIFRR